MDSYSVKKAWQPLSAASISLTVCCETNVSNSAACGDDSASVKSWKATSSTIAALGAKTPTLKPTNRMATKARVAVSQGYLNLNFTGQVFFEPAKARLILRGSTSCRVAGGNVDAPLDSRA